MTTATTPFGRRLKLWRRMRSVSQLDLSTAVGTTPRHLSFLETGRSRPSQEMVDRLAVGLDLPLRDHNELLRAAGFDSAHPEEDLDNAALAPFRVMIDRLLESHEPYPAFVVNRWWDIVEANRAATLFVPEVPVNGVDLFLAPGSLREAIVNFDEVAPVVLARLEAEAAQVAGDERFTSLVARAREMVGDVGEVSHVPQTPAIPVQVTFGDVTLTMVSALARFQSTTEVTLSELRVELFYPLDDATARAFEQMSATTW